MQWPSQISGPELPDEAWDMLSEDAEQPQQVNQAARRRWGRLAIRLRCRQGAGPDGGDESPRGGSRVIYEDIPRLGAPGMWTPNDDNKTDYRFWAVVFAMIVTTTWSLARSRYSYYAKS